MCGRLSDKFVICAGIIEDKKEKKLLVIKANKLHYLSNLFDIVLYVFRTGPLSIIRSISTLYTRSRYVMLVLLAVC